MKQGQASLRCLGDGRRCHVHCVSSQSSPGGLLRPDTFTCRARIRRMGAARCLNASFGVLAGRRPILNSRKRSRGSRGAGTVHVSWATETVTRQRTKMSVDRAGRKSSFCDAGLSFLSLVVVVLPQDLGIVTSVILYTVRGGVPP
jgi:hypothetical protein